MRRALLVFPLLLLLLLPLPVKAEESTAIHSAVEEEEEKLREGLLSVLPDAAITHIGDPTDKDAVNDALGFRALFSLFANTFFTKEGEVRHRLLSILAITFLFCTLALFARGSSTTLFMQSAASLSLFSLVWGASERVFAFFEELSSLTLGLSPLFVSLLAAGGGGASATAAGGGFAAFLSLLELFSTTVFPPLLRTLFALALLSALGNHTLIRELSRRISGLAVFFFSLLSMLLLASLAFQSTLAASADSVALRTVKYTASSAIPLVGGTFSGALGALQASLSLLRSALGGTAVVALLSLLLPPLVEVFLLRLALSFSESIAAFTEASALDEVISRFRHLLDLTLAALVTVSLLFLLSVGVFTRLSPFGA